MNQNFPNSEFECQQGGHFSRRNLVKGASLTAVFAALAASVQPVKVLADTKDELIQQKQNVDSQLQELRDQLVEVDAELAEAYLQLAETEMQIPQAQALLDETRAAAEQARIEDEALAQRLSIAQAQEQEILAAIESGKAEISAQNSEVSRASMQAYVGGGVPTAASVLLGASNPQEAVDRAVNYRLTLQAKGEHLNDLRANQAVQVNSADRLTAVRAEIASLKQQSEAALAARLQAEAEASAAKSALDQLFSTQQQQTSSLETLKSKYEESETRLANQSIQLDSNIAAIIEQERQEAIRLAEEQRRAQQARAAASSGSGSSGSVSPTPGPVVTSGGGRFINPVNARRSSPFGWRIHPVYGTRRMHNGLDYAAGCGTPIMATAAGRVITVSYHPSAGNMVVINHGLHNGQLLTTWYFHLSSFATSVGAQVSQGQVIGYVGTTGTSTGCHLHFETHLDSTPVNPTGFVG